MITLYHGSNIEVPNPLAKVGRKNLDFGRGFYVCVLSQDVINRYLIFVKSILN